MHARSIHVVTNACRSKESGPNLMRQMLGYVYQSRWQEEGQDRSVMEEIAFIQERFRLVKAAGQENFPALEGALAKFREAVLGSPTPGRISVDTFEVSTL